MIRRPLRLLCSSLMALLLSGCALVPQLPRQDAAPRRAPLAAVVYPATYPARRLTYVALGASDTFGYGVPDPASQGWVPRFAAALPPGTRVVNLGVSGITLRRALLVELPVALDAHPDLITIWLAVNDLLGGAGLRSYRADLHTLLARLRAGTHARVLLGNLPDLTLVPAVAGRLGPHPGRRIAAWNAAIAAEARASKATLVDLHASWRDLAAHPEYIGPDGLHPSAAGYAHLAAIFAAALR